MPNIAIATTMWSRVSGEEGKRREDYLKGLLRFMTADGCEIMRFDKSFESAWNIVGMNTNTTSLSLQKLSHQGRSLGDVIVVYGPHKDAFSGWFRQASRIIFGR